MSSNQRLFGRPPFLLPLILPSSIWVLRFWALITCLKYCSFCFLTVDTNSLAVPICDKTNSFVLCTDQLIPSTRLKQVVSKARSLAISAARSVQVSHPYSTTGHMSVFRSFNLVFLWRARSFQNVFRDPRADLDAPSRALIYWLRILRIFPTPLSFGAPALYVRLGICGEVNREENISHGATYGESCMILTSTVFD